MTSTSHSAEAAQRRSRHRLAGSRLRVTRPASATVATLAVLSLVASLLGALATSAGAITPTSWYASAAGSDTAACTQSQPCSLTAALGKAMAGDTILLVTPASQGSYVGNWSVTTTGTTPTTPLTIMPAPGVTNPTLDGNHGTNGAVNGCTTTSCNGSILALSAGVSLSIEGLTLQNANNNNTTGTEAGGAIDTGDGVTGGTVTISNTMFTGDTANVGGGAISNGFNGGGGSTTISGSTFSGNTASLYGGAIDSGGVGGEGSVTISTSTFSGNTAGLFGGAIDSGGVGGGGSVTISTSTFSGNNASEGGAIDSGGGLGGGSVTISTSTFSGNNASTGGAIDSGSFGGGGSVTISTSTFSGNKADPLGGAIDSGDSGGGSVTISTSTFSGNTAGLFGGAIDSGDSGGGSPGAGSVTLVASTLVTNTAGAGPAVDNGGGGSLTAAADLFAGSCDQGTSWTDAGYNAATDASCLNGGTRDVSSTAVSQLGALANNGGPTETILPLTGNPALGLIPNPTTVMVGTSSVTLCPTVDQRGVPSTPGASCAAGSVQPSAGASCAGSVQPSAGAISITGNHLGSITLSSGQSLCIGPGASFIGAITLNPGSSLDIEGASVHGAISATGATGVRICASTLSGPVTIAKSKGLVVIGDDEGSPACAGNTITGAVSITANTAGVEFDDNTVTAPVTITSNAGSVPPPDTGSVVAVGNTISGSKTIQ